MSGGYISIVVYMIAVLDVYFLSIVLVAKVVYNSVVVGDVFVYG